MWLNHKHKLIFVRIAKTGSTSVLRHVEDLLCNSLREEFRPDQAILVNCSSKDIWDPWPDDDLQVKELWEEYFVFATVRNVWTRTRSAYQFLLQIARDAAAKNVHGAKVEASWQEFCADPSVLARRA